MLTKREKELIAKIESTMNDVMDNVLLAEDYLNKIEEDTSFMRFGEEDKLIKENIQTLAKDGKDIVIPDLQKLTNNISELSQICKEEE